MQFQGFISKNVPGALPKYAPYAPGAQSKCLRYNFLVRYETISRFCFCKQYWKTPVLLVCWGKVGHSKKKLLSHVWRHCELKVIFIELPTLPRYTKSRDLPIFDEPLFIFKRVFDSSHSYIHSRLIESIVKYAFIHIIEMILSAKFINESLSKNNQVLSAGYLMETNVYTRKD